MTVFVDTSALLAVLNADDDFHAPAKELWEQLVSQGDRLICSNYILVETFALLQRRFGMAAVRVFQLDVLPVLIVRWIDEEIHNRAASAMIAADRRYLSLVDCSSFEMMHALGLTQVFTFDAHFSEYGFTPLA